MLYFYSTASLCLPRYRLKIKFMFEQLKSLSEIAPLAIPLAAIVAFFTYRGQLKAQRLKSSLEFSKEFSQNKVLQDALNKYIELSINRLEVPIESWAKPELQLSIEAQAIRTLINEFERLSAGIKHKIYDEDFIYNSHATYIIRAHTNLSPYMNVQKSLNPRLFKGFDELALKWKVRRDKK